jgi:hypothetical protein
LAIFATLRTAEQRLKGSSASSRCSAVAEHLLRPRQRVGIAAIKEPGLRVGKEPRDRLAGLPPIGSARSSRSVSVKQRCRQSAQGRRLASRPARAPAPAAWRYSPRSVAPHHPLVVNLSLRDFGQNAQHSTKPDRRTREAK